MLILDLINAIWDTIMGKKPYISEEREEIFERNVLSPEELEEIQNSDESSTYICTSDPADRIQGWKREEASSGDSSDSDGSYWDSACEAAADRMAGDTGNSGMDFDAGNDSGGGDSDAGGDFE